MAHLLSPTAADRNGIVERKSCHMGILVHALARFRRSDVLLSLELGQDERAFWLVYAIFGKI